MEAWRGTGDRRVASPIIYKGSAGWHCGLGLGQSEGPHCGETTVLWT
jgi:hypothetical protein